MRVLVVEDERVLADAIATGLRREAMAVDVAYDGAAALERTSVNDYDVVVLDRDLPRVHGDEVCRRLVADGAATRVLMLTAAGEETDRIVGLEMGADDYLPKPFNPRELLARIRAVLRRTEDGGRPVGEADTSMLLHFEGFQLDLGARRLAGPEGNDIDLSAGEFDLLAALAQRPRRVLSRDQLLDLCKGRAAQPFDRSIDVQVGRLRRKIEPDPSEPRIITTVRGGGYMFAPEVTRGGKDPVRGASASSAEGVGPPGA